MFNKKPQELARAEAVTQLQAHFEKEDRTAWLELADDERGGKRFGCPFEGCADLPFENFNGLTNGWNTLVKLNQRGLVTFQLLGKTQPNSWDGYALFKVSLSDQAKKFVMKETAEGPRRKVQVRISELKTVEVTGVGAAADMLGKKISVVSYRVTRQPTLFGEVFTEGTVGRREENGNAHFVLYDSGWRLEDVN